MLSKIIETDLGFEVTHENYICFFGKASASLEEIKKNYSQFRFREIYQTHSDILISSNQSSHIVREADAHWTNQSDTALVIRTADCLPVMIYDSQIKMILAIHAGWKGVANQITKKSLNQLNLKKIDVIIGPHIMQKSFEVTQDAYQMLLACYQDALKGAFKGDSTKVSKENMLEASIFQSQDEHFYIDLSEIVKAQVLSITQEAHFILLNKDTKSDRCFHSYRRDKNCGRNYSFIAMRR